VQVKNYALNLWYYNSKMKAKISYIYILSFLLFLGSCHGKDSQQKGDLALIGILGVLSIWLITMWLVSKIKQGNDIKNVSINNAKKNKIEPKCSLCKDRGKVMKCIQCHEIVFASKYPGYRDEFEYEVYCKNCGEVDDFYSDDCDCHKYDYY
jgi:hypothetical protein